MDAGLVYSRALREIRIAIPSGQVQRDDTSLGASISARLSWLYQVSVPEVNTGIYLACATHKAGARIPADAHEYRIWIPLLGLDQRRSFSGFRIPMETTIEIDNLKIYVLNSAEWSVRWTALRWKIEGVTELTLGAVERRSSHLTPAGVPFFGIPPQITAGASAEVAQVI